MVDPRHLQVNKPPEKVLLVPFTVSEFVAIANSLTENFHTLESTLFKYNHHLVDEYDPTISEWYPLCMLMEDAETSAGFEGTFIYFAIYLLSLPCIRL